MNTQRPLSAESIYHTVSGYHTSSDDAAFKRMFERDKNELKSLGVPIELAGDDADGQPGYRILRTSYELPNLHFAPSHLAVISAAADFLAGSDHQGHLDSAITKLLASGHISVRRTDNIHHDDGSESVREAVNHVIDAVSNGKVIEFEYTTREGKSAVRTVEPWRVTTSRANWYLAGFDRDRNDTRVYRISRMGKLRVVDEERTCKIPAIAHLDKLISAAASHHDVSIDAVVWIEHGCGQDIRARANKILDIDEYTAQDPHPAARQLGNIVDSGHVVFLSDISDGWIIPQVCALGENALVLAPTTLGEQVSSQLQALTVEQHHG